MGGSVQHVYQGLPSDQRAGGIAWILVQAIRWQIHQGESASCLTSLQFIIMSASFFISAFNHLISFLSACQGVGESGEEFVSLLYSTCLFW